MLWQLSKQGGTFLHKGSEGTLRRKDSEFEAYEHSSFSGVAGIRQLSIQIEPRATTQSAGEQSQPLHE